MSVDTAHRYGCLDASHRKLQLSLEAGMKQYSGAGLRQDQMSGVGSIQVGKSLLNMCPCGARVLLGIKPEGKGHIDGVLRRVFDWDRCGADDYVDKAMSKKVFDRIKAGMMEALAIARGEKEPAKRTTYCVACNGDCGQCSGPTDPSYVWKDGRWVRRWP